jgi:hypothetical protein
MPAAANNHYFNHHVKAILFPARQLAMKKHCPLQSYEKTANLR